MSDEYINLFDDLDEYFFDSENSIDSFLKRESMFFKLKDLYLKIINIADYENYQKRLYGSRTKRQIIDLELSRIKTHTLNDKSIVENVLNIEKLLKLYDNDKEITDVTYEKIINLIIRLELSLDMNVGLFNEVCKLYEKENKMVEGISYKKI